MSGATPWMPPPEKDYNAAKRQYVEQYGSLIVMNTYLKVALLALSVAIVALVVLNIRTYQAARDVKPLVVRINDVGRAEALKYDDFAYQPQEGEIRYFLSDFIQRHYSRMRATLRDNYARSLFFLDGRLADALIEANKKTNAIELFLAGSGDEIEVKVTNVSIQDLRNSPYRATADFEKIYYAPATRDVAKREKYVANIVFVKKDHVPNEMIPVNPLGLTITYFREDQAFE
jgi:type IV secretory pathway TrbF-like protein